MRRQQVNDSTYSPHLLLHPRHSEDSKYAQTMDATRLSDGKYVTLKRINKSVHPHEADTRLYFSSGTLTSHTANHCVPIYEAIPLQDDADMVILVVPLLRAYEDPTLTPLVWR